MKKLILTVFVVLLFSVSGWASESATPEATASESSVESNAPAMGINDSSVETPSTPESSTQKGMVPDDNIPAVTETDSAPADIEPEKPQHGFGHKLLFYIPNRILDVFDIVRLRVRVGPGLALGARLTKPLSVFIGGYGSVYVGLPGPRMKPTVKLPIGIENYGGMSLSFLDATNEGRFAPNYSPTEIGCSIQALIIGADVDVDPVEVLDLATGLLFIDLRGDDL